MSGDNQSGTASMPASAFDQAAELAQGSVRPFRGESGRDRARCQGGGEEAEGPQ